MKSSARPIIAILLIVVAAIAFWTLALSPKRSEADKLDAQIETLNASVETARNELAQATVARHTFPTAYHQLVEFGQAVPASDETPSLLVELQTLARDSEVAFESIQLNGEGEAAPESAAPAESTEATATPESSTTGTPAAAVVPATEVEASLMPLGASIGTAGLAVMPYTLEFKGTFFGIAMFIGKVDQLVKSSTAKLAIDGRLVTISSFSLTAEGGEGEEGDAASGSPVLKAAFSVTTYLTPPGQGIAAGATPTAPAESTSQTVSAE